MAESSSSPGNELLEKVREAYPTLRKTWQNPIRFLWVLISPRASATPTTYYTAFRNLLWPVSLAYPTYPYSPTFLLDPRSWTWAAEAKFSLYWRTLWVYDCITAKRCAKYRFNLGFSCGFKNWIRRWTFKSLLRDQPWRTARRLPATVT